MQDMWTSAATSRLLQYSWRPSQSRLVVQVLQENRRTLFQMGWRDPRPKRFGIMSQRFFRR
jgi:hypothetical protein